MLIRPLEFRDRALFMLDQRLLPGQEVWMTLRTWQEVADAIRDMAVRGAPAIGIAAGYALALAAQSGDSLPEASAGLAAARPTAVNLFWAIDRIRSLGTSDPVRVLAEAQAMEEHDLAMNQEIGRWGATLVPNHARILTICNTGSLATSGHGTALGIIRTAHEQGKVEHVYACETRPRQQGLRLTAWELIKDQISFQAIVDSAAGYLMQLRKVDLVIAGADRIAANGDTANKIGTCSLAILAHHHSIPFVIAAPCSTLDPSLQAGLEIPIEERDAIEVTHTEGIPVAPAGCPVWNPAFDITPGCLISHIVTERGIASPPYGF